jgi:shikimate kinase
MNSEKRKTILAFIGYRGTGKSTIARLTAAKLGLPCWDSDAEIEKRASRSIESIFRELGEEGFRDLETQEIERLIQQSPSVLSLGGGAILRPANRPMIAAHCHVVWLKASAEVILLRLRADQENFSQRPRLTPLDPLDEIRSLLALREPYYSEAAGFSIDTDRRTPPEIVDCVVDWWNGIQGGVA